MHGGIMARIAIHARRTVLGLLLTALMGCAASFTNHGYAPTDTELQAITVGRDTRATVEAAIGRPSSTGVLKSSGWYYLSSRIKHFTYNQPKVIDRQLVAISFSNRGVVQNVERFTLNDGRVIALNRRVTTSGIKGFSFMRQLLQNIGNVDIGKALQ